MSVKIQQTHDGWAHAASPFHAGEQEVQERVGVRDVMESFGRRVVRDFMPDQHRAFFAQLPFVAVGSVDSQGQPWASLLAGEPGFMVSPDKRQLQIDAKPVTGDPLTEALVPGTSLGLLGLDFADRRRNRLNLRVDSVANGIIALTVDQSFGNCPQYIQTRSLSFTRDPKQEGAAGAVTQIKRLDEEARTMITSADAFFVASSYEAGEDQRREGADVSHRGGRPGFVKVEQGPNDDVLTIPDYSGNSHYNTLGNFLLNPKAGLTFIDFENGDLLMLTGEVEIIWDGPEVEAFQGAERAWRFKVTRGVRARDALPLRWRFGEYSPNSLITGNWQEAEATLAAEAKRNAWRDYRVTRIEDESEVIRSFYLEPIDGDGLLGFEAGQYLTIRVTPEGQEKPVGRTYTLSSAPSDKFYRISVKREPGRSDEHPEGLVSNFLHDRITIGDKIEARAPRGDFTFDAAEKRPAVLLAGGVGITPMISMAQHAVHEGLRTRHLRPITLIHSAQTTTQRAFFEEASRLSEASGGLVRSFSLISRPAKDERPGRDFHGQGRITADVLREILPLDDYDFFLCGPSTFMQGLYDTLRGLGVRDARIAAEAFGPASLVRRPDEGTTIAEIPKGEEAENALVAFADSDFEQRWSPEAGTLLELAEAHGLSPDYGCRNGTCGTCATKLNAGSVAYRSIPSASVAENEVLICCAVPAKDDTGSERVELAL
ncbi:pyridoxamine 5'-phosphate oxidase family protein [Pelagibius sp. Alg239-R121]|uniref:2Fe-2S iron-sulfur cluster-binding protein n=1 Tax=Pelagibius sp. Alg239-R121 TaxID=2993448 RepID=UPI0024A66FE0|nr:pyridoxamine 5'-phosphate oxidase family protein [Pelagibius sp. Alg239-R121]